MKKYKTPRSISYPLSRLTATAPLCQKGEPFIRKITRLKQGSRKAEGCTRRFLGRGATAEQAMMRLFEHQASAASGDDGIGQLIQNILYFSADNRSRLSANPK